MRQSNNIPAGRGLALLAPTAALCAALLSSCAHPAPVMLNGRTAVISGRQTIDDSMNDASRKVMIEAAAITLDHGYRYFELADPVRPGADVTIRVLGTGEVGAHTAGVWDADAIAAGELPPNAASAAADSKDR